MGRPQGSKNKSTIEIEKLQARVNELETQYNSYDEVIDAFTEGFVIDLYKNGTIKNIDTVTLQKWFNSPDEYIEQINNLLVYHYIINGDIFQLYDLIFTLPDLDYRIKVYDKDDQYEQDIKKIKQYIERRVNHTHLTRDLSVQLATKGTLMGTWLGNNKNPYFYTFDNLNYIYPYGRSHGKMIGVIDLKWLDGMKEEERQSIYSNLKPFVTQQKYEKYKNLTDRTKEKEVRYIQLPVDKSLVARLHTLSRNQRLGIPTGTQALFDIAHKQKLKTLEIAIADQIIKAFAVLKFRGKDDNDVKVKFKDRKDVYNGVKKALEKNTSDKTGITCIAIPDFASFEFPELKNGEKALDPAKYESIDNDITSATGISNVLTNGTKGNYASAKLNLDIIYKKIGVILEQIEEIYNQLIVLILGEERGFNYKFEYNKETPLERSKKLETLMKLQAQGYSTKHVLDMIGIDANEYFKQTFYEIDELKLRERVIPPMTSYTTSGKDGRGNTGGDQNNDNTVNNTEIDGNNTPKANV